MLTSEKIKFFLKKSTYGNLTEMGDLKEFVCFAKNACVQIKLLTNAHKNGLFSIKIVRK